MTDGLDLETMRRIAEGTFVPRVHDAHGQPGTLALRHVIGFLLQFYGHLDPEMVTGVLYVVRLLREEDSAALAGALSGSFWTEKRIDRLPLRAPDVLVIELLDGGILRVRENGTVDENAASRVALVYRYRSQQEHFILQGQALAIENPAAIHASVFARPTFSFLRDALFDYRDRFARLSTCFILQTAWAEDARLFFKPKPEFLIRRSLSQHLATVLRDAEVRPEQNVDETHPIDIKVTWTFTTRLGIIEIKWLGKSRENDSITTTYTESRALEGARQLADYLDANRRYAPKRDTLGYLVIIDARRHGLGPGSTAVSRANGMYYDDREITYDPPYHQLRDDFAPPIRMFVEPVCQDAA